MCVHITHSPFSLDRRSQKSQFAGDNQGKQGEESRSAAVFISGDKIEHLHNKHLFSDCTRHLATTTKTSETEESASELATEPRFPLLLRLRYAILCIKLFVARSFAVGRLLLTEAEKRGLKKNFSTRAKYIAIKFKPAFSCVCRCLLQLTMEVFLHQMR